MPKHPNYITVPAVITKAQIADTAKLMSCANAFHCEVNGVVYDPYKIRYATFAGSRKDDGLYHGEHRFEYGDWKDAKPADLNGLPNAMASQNRETEIPAKGTPYPVGDES